MRNIKRGTKLSRAFEARTGDALSAQNYPISDLCTVLSFTSYAQNLFFNQA